LVIASSQEKESENNFVDLVCINLHFRLASLSQSFFRVFIQPGLKELLESNALVSPLPVKGAQVKLPILLVIRPRGVVGKDTSDVMHGVRQVEKLLLVEPLVVRTATKEEKNLIEQVSIRSQNGVRRTNNEFHGSARVLAER